MKFYETDSYHFESTPTENPICFVCLIDRLTRVCVCNNNEKL